MTSSTSRHDVLGHEARERLHLVEQLAAPSHEAPREVATSQQSHERLRFAPHPPQPLSPCEREEGARQERRQKDCERPAPRK
jgi:hypothetical protein